MFKSNYVRNISKSLLTLYAATAITAATPSTSYAEDVIVSNPVSDLWDKLQKEREKRRFYNRIKGMSDSAFIWNYGYLGEKELDVFTKENYPDHLQKFEFHVLDKIELYIKNNNGKLPTALPSQKYWNFLTGRTIQGPQIERKVGGQEIVTRDTTLQYIKLSAREKRTKITPPVLVTEKTPTATLDSIVINFGYLYPYPTDFGTEQNPKLYYARMIQKKYFDKAKKEQKYPAPLVNQGYLDKINRVAATGEEKLGDQTVIGREVPDVMYQKPDTSKITRSSSLREPLPQKPQLETKISQQKPVRIVKRDTKLSLKEGELPKGTSIVTTQDNSDFLKTPVRTPYYRFGSAWGLIEGLGLASGRSDISDLLAAALPETEKYMSDLGVSETVIRRHKRDDKKVVGGKTVRGADGLPLDNILLTDNLFWSARVLAERDYEYITPEVREKAKEQLEEKVKPDTLRYEVKEPTLPEPTLPQVTATRIVQIEKKQGMPLWCKIGIGLGVGSLAYAILSGKEEEKPKPPTQTGTYDDDFQPGVH